MILQCYEKCSLQVIPCGSLHIIMYMYVNRKHGARFTAANMCCYVSLCPRPPLARAIKRGEARGRPSAWYNLSREGRKEKGLN